MKHDKSSFEVSFAYIHGRIEAQIEAFANSIGIPSRQLAARVGALLSATAGGAVLGPVDSMPDMRRTAAEHDSAARPLALAGGSHGEAARTDLNSAGNRRGMTNKPAAKRASSIKNYWHGMTKEQRAAEMARRRKVSLHKRAMAKDAEVRARNAEKKRLQRARQKEQVSEASAA